MPPVLTRVSRVSLAPGLRALVYKHMPLAPLVLKQVSLAPGALVPWGPYGLKANAPGPWPWYLWLKHTYPWPWCPWLNMPLAPGAPGL